MQLWQLRAIQLKLEDHTDSCCQQTPQASPAAKTLANCTRFARHLNSTHHPLTITAHAEDPGTCVQSKSAHQLAHSPACSICCTDTLILHASIPSLTHSPTDSLARMLPGSLRRTCTQPDICTCLGCPSTAFIQPSWGLFGMNVPSAALIQLTCTAV